MGSHRVGHDWSDLAPAAENWCKHKWSWFRSVNSVLLAFYIALDKSTNIDSHVSIALYSLLRFFSNICLYFICFFSYSSGCKSMQTWNLWTISILWILSFVVWPLTFLLYFFVKKKKIINWFTILCHMDNIVIHSFNIFIVNINL